MSKNGSHDLTYFMRQATTEMAAEYQRIRMRTRADPGTAGDEGEENWAELLRAWLPTTFHAVTKGRILFSNGESSGQHDVLVLSPSYPKGLLSKKYYLAAGVVAAFECKTTLRPEHIKKVVRSSVRLGQLSRGDRSVRQHIVYGLLAHSHDIPSKRRSAGEVLSTVLRQVDKSEVNDSRDCLDLVCVADLGTWTLMRLPTAPRDETSVAAVETCYMEQLRPQPEDIDIPGLFPDPIGRFLTSLLGRLTPVDPALRAIASYFFDAGQYGTGSGQLRHWELTEKSEDFQYFTW